jgi:hypothetical protein
LITRLHHHSLLLATKSACSVRVSIFFLLADLFSLLVVVFFLAKLTKELAKLTKEGKKPPVGRVRIFLFLSLAPKQFLGRVHTRMRTPDAQAHT